jgi:hypothetical protein
VSFGGKVHSDQRRWRPIGAFPLMSATFTWRVFGIPNGRGDFDHDVA